MTTHKSFAARADIEAILESRDAVRTDIPVLQPADPFLDTAGEELRRRIYLTQSDAGAAMCLRPEFTIPVCLAHIKNNAAQKRYGYVGTVFRQKRDGASEFLQAGIEDIGDEDVTRADARSLGDSLACLKALSAPEDCQIVIGDQAVFDAVLSALGLPSGWRIRLTQAFGDDAVLSSELSRLSEPTPMPIVPDDVQAAIESGDMQSTEKTVQAHLINASLVDAGGRSAAEITQRLFAKIRAAQTVPDRAKLDVLRDFLRLRVPIAQSTAMLEAFEKKHDLDIAAALSVFAKRNAAFVAAGIDLANATYSASFGRSLDYYTGLVYEVRGPDGDVLVGGGRYDKLLPLLGAKSETKGVGFSIWMDRIGGKSQ